MKTPSNTASWASSNAITWGSGESQEKKAPAEKSGAACQKNVSQGERYGSAIAGGALLLSGLKMRSLAGAAIATIGGLLLHRGITGRCQAYRALGINTAEGEGARPEEFFERGIHVTASVTINAPASELYKFWRNFENVSRIMDHIRAVEVLDDRRSRWHAKAPAGFSVSWEAEIINDVPNEKIAWRSLYPATISNAGSVRFAEGPEGRGTEVTVTLDYIPPAGKMGWAIAKLFGNDPAAAVREDLRWFKSIFETGESPTIKGQPHGERSKTGALLAAIAS